MIVFYIVCTFRCYKYILCNHLTLMCVIFVELKEHESGTNLPIGLKGPLLKPFSTTCSQDCYMLLVRNVYYIIYLS